MNIYLNRFAFTFFIEEGLSKYCRYFWIHNHQFPNIIPHPSHQRGMSKYWLGWSTIMKTIWEKYLRKKFAWKVCFILPWCSSHRIFAYDPNFPVSMAKKILKLVELLKSHCATLKCIFVDLWINYRWVVSSKNHKRCYSYKRCW